MPSITYCNQNIIHLAYHSDFLYIYHTPEFFNNIDQDNAIPLEEDLSKIQKDLEKVSKLKDFEISSNDDFFSKAIKAAPTLQNKKKSNLFNSLAIENNEKN